MFWKTRARYQPGKLVGAFILGLRPQPLRSSNSSASPTRIWSASPQATGLHMGQWLSLPMILGGLYLVLTASKREERVQPVPADEPAAA